MSSSNDRTGHSEPVSRRDALGILGAVCVATVGHFPLVGTRDVAGSVLETELDCVVTPAQTEGPYFVDERLNRVDLRLDPATKVTSEGLPLRLRLHVNRVTGGACTPVREAMVDVWQCDALGIYSDVRDMNGLFDTRGRKFLRGYQLTGSGGSAEFLTVYPGWYEGRAVHIHFKVRVPAGAARAHEFTSQLYFDEAVTDLVHAQPPYNSKGQRDTRNDRDGIFRRDNTGSALMLRLSRDGGGYLGDMAIGLRMG